jgi:signal transduction histidine kinase
VNADAERGRVLLEESRELVVVLDEDDRVVAASRRAREALEGLAEGLPVPTGLTDAEDVVVVPYELDGRRERLVYVGGGDFRAYEELRAGFTAAVSHELRTPLARLLVLLETALLPGEDPRGLVGRRAARWSRSRS